MMPSTLPKHTDAKAQYVIKLNTPELWGYPLPTDIHTQPKRNWPINANTKRIGLDRSAKASVQLSINLALK